MEATGGGQVLSSSGRDAGELLGAVERVSKETRRARHGYWFPLLLSGLIILGNLPFNYFSIGHYGGPTRLVFGLCLCNGVGQHIFGSTVYWLIAFPTGFAAVASYYVIRARRTGLQVRIWPYIVTGLALFAFVVLTGVQVPKPLRFMYRIDVWRYRATPQGLAPVLAISLALFALAAIERSKALWAITVSFFGVALLANLYNISNVGQRIHWIWPDWAANLAASGGFLVFVGVLSLIGLGVGGRRHGAPS